MKPFNEIKIGLVMRQGKATVKNTIATKDLIVNVLESARCSIDEAMATLREGNTYKFKHCGFNITLQPLLNHCEYY